MKRREAGFPWLELLFGLLLAGLVVLCLTDSIREAELDYGNRLHEGGPELGTVGMDEYLDRIRELRDCTAVITVKDIGGYCTPPEALRALKDLGFDRADELGATGYRSFIGIWSDGEMLYQEIGENRASAWGQYVGGQYVYAFSATWGTGNLGEIFVNQVQYAVNNRGYNIVVFDHRNRTLIDSVAYDVYVPDVPVYRLVDGEPALIASTVKE